MSRRQTVRMASDPVNRALDGVLAHVREVPVGAVADYIPALSTVDPALLAISVTSVSGHVYEAGDIGATFTIQSMSKPFVYALALRDLGVDALHAHVGFEPSGEPFNAISLDRAGRPANPMINAGAIVTSALIGGATSDERFERIRAGLSAFAGRALTLNHSIYQSEAKTGDRNRALAYLTLSAGTLTRGADDATDVYFRQCSIDVTTRDLSLMGATLANSGTNPETGVNVVDPFVARRTLTLMSSCGMYDRAGEWAFRVGVPAKSGVSGGIVAVKPGQFGVGVFSPGLDEAGNSSRGVAALTLLSEEFGLHLLERPRTHLDPIADITRGPGPTVTVVLRGELDFVAMEHVIYEVQAAVDEASDVTTIRLDVGAVSAITAPAERMLQFAVARAAEAGRTVAVIRE